jgi:hypothetical protein
MINSIVFTIIDEVLTKLLNLVLCEPGLQFLEAYHQLLLVEPSTTRLTSFGFPNCEESLV